MQIWYWCCQLDFKWEILKHKHRIYKVYSTLWDEIIYKIKFAFWVELQKTMDRKIVVRAISVRHCLARTITNENTVIQKQQQQNTKQKRRENKRVSNNLETTLYKRKRTVIVKRWSFTLVMWRKLFAQITGMRVWSKVSTSTHIISFLEKWTTGNRFLTAGDSVPHTNRPCNPLL